MQLLMENQFQCLVTDNQKNFNYMIYLLQFISTDCESKNTQFQIY